MQENYRATSLSDWTDLWTVSNDGYPGPGPRPQKKCAGIHRLPHHIPLPLGLSPPPHPLFESYKRPWVNPSFILMNALRFLGSKPQQGTEVRRRLDKHERGMFSLLATWMAPRAQTGGRGASSPIKNRSRGRDLFHRPRSRSRCSHCRPTFGARRGGFLSSGILLPFGDGKGFEVNRRHPSVWWETQAEHWEVVLG